MTNIEFITKYPDIGENGIISLQKVGVYMSLKQISMESHSQNGKITQNQIKVY